MKKAIYIPLLALIGFMACCSEKNNSETKEQASKTSVITATTETKTAVYPVDSLPSNFEKLVGQDIFFKGNVQHVCKHSGKKAFLVGENPKTKVRVMAKGKIKAFGGDLIGEELVVKGTVKEMRIDEAYLARWEAQLEKAKSKQTKKRKEALKKADEASCDSGNSPIDKIRAEIKANGKGYKSVYYIDGLEYTVSDDQ
ncbi:hypothetical protein FUAX_18700 [Fulvitalea axinellae]|uniref:tRNA_anti-like n=1 Tax=Fulvitalea axinellae TaxID=1182444 RepID=A0AAU9CN28_9BACT|nr:hypothetical protein FUAX_18700 [Fulvitalea axinellae]